jgi:hypothetical protein
MFSHLWQRFGDPYDIQLLIGALSSLIATAVVFLLSMLVSVLSRSARLPRQWQRERLVQEYMSYSPLSQDWQAGS